MLRERKIRYNQLKRTDVFTCGFTTHKSFRNAVSVYHVLREKQCFPNGCVYFLWKCRRLNQGKSCRRKFSHVGRLCFNCPEFYDEKICFSPKRVLTSEKFAVFQRELEDFEEWFQWIEEKEIDFTGMVFSVKPSLVQYIDGKKDRIGFDGFLVVFKEGYFHYDRFEDFCYLKISKSQQERYRFRAGDEIECSVIVKMNKGRIVLKRPRRIEIQRRVNDDWELGFGENLSLHTPLLGTVFGYQPEKCMVCEKGCLIDVKQVVRDEVLSYRRLFCLAGVEDPGLCPYPALKKLRADICQKDKASAYIGSDVKIELVS